VPKFPVDSGVHEVSKYDGTVEVAVTPTLAKL
jgi:hypothetical protein